VHILDLKATRSEILGSFVCCEDAMWKWSFYQ